MEVAPLPETKLSARLWKWTKRLLVLALVGLLLTVAAGAATYLYYDRGLPSAESLSKWVPPQGTKVLCNGVVCAEFFRERRTVVPIASLPPHVKNAFLAAEDADFYKHEGLDYVGMTRATLKGLLPGKRMAGASTITQQTVKNLLLTPERKLSRKIREWILTPRLEKALSKDRILELYVNSIYFGQNRYGIEEAALFYFGKHARELSVGEAALLAGVPQQPHRINPVTNIVKAKRRQQYVLGQLSRHGFLPADVTAAEMDKPIVLAPRPPPPAGAYYAEEVRKALVARYGEAKVMEGGMRVEIAMDPLLQAYADASVQAGLEAVDRRQGFRGAHGELPAPRAEALFPLVKTRVEEAGKRKPDEVLVADLEPLADALAALANPPVPVEDVELRPEGAKTEKEARAIEEGAEERPTEVAEGEVAPSEDEVLAKQVALRPLAAGMKLTAWVRAVDDAKKTAELDLVTKKARMDFSTVSWARKAAVGKWTQPPQKMSDVVKPGDLVRVRVLEVGATKDAPAVVTLDQVPLVQGALAVIDPTNRHVVAMTGGYDFRESAFNRATQAKRQPGSSFKPFVYGAALLSQRFTPISIVNDAPEAVFDPGTGKTWKPKNFEADSYDGPITLRQALTLSKNTVSVRLIEAITPAAAIDFARKAGITSPLPENLTLALGTGEVSPLELANGYATLHSMGRFAEPITIVKVSEADGRILEEHHAAFEERLPPAAAYLVGSLMRSVVEQGTATAVKELKRPAAGKTGTASEHRDAWFAGFTQDLVAAAWVGFDDHGMLGRGETGGKAALPIWLEFMKPAHEGKPARDFERPAGVVEVRIDPSTGLLAGGSVPGRLEPFWEGTQPTTEAPPDGQVDPNRFMMEDDGSRRR